MSSVMARSWARASARTLSRRLRREYRKLEGDSRAQALHRRVSAFRSALVAHWHLEDKVGASYPYLSDAIKAAKLMGIVVDAEQEYLVVSN